MPVADASVLPEIVRRSPEQESFRGGICLRPVSSLSILLRAVLQERNAMAERLGDYMIRMGAMNQSQVDEVARIKATGDRRHFGDIAISLGFIKATDVEAFLASQK